MIERSRLESVWSEVNRELAPDPPPPDIARMGDEEVIDILKELAAQVLRKDEFGDDTWRVLLELGGLQDDVKKEIEEMLGKEKEVVMGTKGKNSGTKKKEKKSGEKRKKEDSLSNKGQVWQLWNKGKSQADDLSNIIDGAVKLTTIKSWIRQWKKGKNLPAIAKK